MSAHTPRGSFKALFDDAMTRPEYWKESARLLHHDLESIRALVIELLCEYRSHSGHQVCRSGSSCYVGEAIDKLEALIGADVIKRELLPPADRERGIVP